MTFGWERCPYEQEAEVPVICYETFIQACITHTHTATSNYSQRSSCTRNVSEISLYNVLPQIPQQKTKGFGGKSEFNLDNETA